MTQPELAVIIPTHNRRALLSETLDRVLCEHRVGLEVVVVDDGSDDDTFDWLQSLTDPRVRALRQDPSRRAAAARNLGLAEVRSPYVMTLDDDDLLLPGALPLLLAEMTRRARCIGAAGTYITFGTGVDPFQPPHVPLPVSTTLWREELFGWNLPPGTSVWRTSAVRDAGGWDESLTRCEDLDFNLRLGRDRVALIPAPVLHYRVHAGQAQGEVRARDLELDEEIRDQFIATLGPRDRRTAESITAARAEFTVALDAYVNGRFGEAAPRLAAVLRAAPSLLRSPVLAPWLLGLLAKSAASAVAPPSFTRAVARRRRDNRRRVLEENQPA